MEDSYTTVPAHIYQLGFDDYIEYDVSSVKPEDAKYIIENNLQLSVEEMENGDFGVYIAQKNGDDKEFVELALGRTCEDTIHTLLIAYRGAKCQK